MSAAQTPLWDLPIRVFHWSIVLLLPLAWWTGEEGEFDWHARIGYTILVLVAVRVLWGFVGSRHARFSDFLAGPARVLRYLRGDESGGVGHNPAGGWSVIVLLGLLLLQGVSGLFNTDDTLFSGPLHYAASTGFRDTMGELHEITFDLLVVLVVLHIAAVLFYQFRRGEPLLQAMLRGYSAGKQGLEKPRPWWWALLLVVLVSLALWWGLEQAPRPPPMW